MDAGNISVGDAAEARRLLDFVKPHINGLNDFFKAARNAGPAFNITEVRFTTPDAIIVIEQDDLYNSNEMAGAMRQTVADTFVGLIGYTLRLITDALGADAVDLQDEWKDTLTPAENLAIMAGMPIDLE